MYIRNNQQNDSIWKTAILCAIVFVVFSMLWLWKFQEDLMYLKVEVLFKGKYVYDIFWGAAAITAILLALALFISGLTRVKGCAYALNYMPSMMGLAALTDVGADGNLGALPTYWWWLLPVLFVLWLVLIVFAGRVNIPYSLSIGTRRLWVNLMLMVLMSLGVACLSNTNASLHYRAQIEHALLEQQDKGVLEAGEESLEADASLTMLRIHVLSRQGELGNQLFRFPVVGTSEDMLPLGGNSNTLAYSIDSIYRHLGPIPKGIATTHDYLDQLEKQHRGTKAVADYKLCGWLIDRDIDTFAKNISKYYTVNDSLPRYYREALVLYTHMRSMPVLVYHNTVMDVDFEDLRKLEQQYTDFTERKVRVEEKYANSYWFYFYYRI